MNVQYISLEALVLKATHESLREPDEDAIEAFCTIMREGSDGAQLASRVLSSRIHSRNPKEALLALAMVDKCMRRCDPVFHSEIGKFRFLNEMIKLVSPKYYAQLTTPEVQEKVLQLLHTWSLEYPKETKFKVAYDMLKNQGVIKEPPLAPDLEDQPPVHERQRNSIFEDEEKAKLLQKLLQSKKPEDLNHANRLIKNMVKEEEKRMSRQTEVSRISGLSRNWGDLLEELMENYEEGGPEQLELLTEVHASCQGLLTTLQDLCTTMPDHDPYIGTLVQANSDLVTTLEKYKSFMSTRAQTVAQTSPAAGDSLLDFAEGQSDVSTKVKADGDAIGKNAIDELSDIFSSAASSIEPLKPILPSKENAEPACGDTKAEDNGVWGELDLLGDMLMKQSLPDNAKRLDGFGSKTTKKIPMNALDKAPSNTDKPVDNDTPLDLDFFLTATNTNKNTNQSNLSRNDPATIPKMNLTQATPSSTSDDLIIDIRMDPNGIRDNFDCMLDIISLDSEKLEATKTNDGGVDKTNSNQTVSSNEAASGDLTIKNASEFPLKDRTDSDVAIKKIPSDSEIKPLTDVFVTIDSVRPSEVPSITAFEDENLSVVLHFAKNKPRDDTNVIVVSTTSRCSEPIDNFKFQPVLPKNCKWRLLPASGSSLPALKPFLPPPALTQLLLVACPSLALGPTLKFAVTYTCGPEDLSEIGQVDNLPLDKV